MPSKKAFIESATVPKCKECAKQGNIDEKGMVLYYTNQCPHTEKYATPVKVGAVQENL